MTQIARPTSDVSTGNWTPTPIFQDINSVAKNDSVFVESGNNPENDTFEVRLRETLAWPQDGAQTLTVRLRRVGSSSEGIWAIVQLIQGDSVIATRAVKNPETSFEDGEEEFTIVLSEYERRAITDYTDLRLRVTATGAPTCGGCPTTTPMVMQVSFRGFTNHDCGSCTRFNEEAFSILLEDNGNSSVCHWGLYSPSVVPCAGYDNITVTRLQSSGSIPGELRVVLGHNVGQPPPGANVVTTFSLELPDSAACTGQYDVPFQSTTTFYGDFCGVDQATAIVDFGGS